MLNLKNTTTNNESKSIKDEFFHSMRDDLDSLSDTQKSSSPRNTAIEAKKREDAFSSSPFFNNNNVSQDSVFIKKPIEEKQTLKSQLTGDIDEIYSDKNLQEFHKNENKKGTRLNMYILVSLIFIIALGVCAFFYWKTAQQKPPSNENPVRYQDADIKTANSGEEGGQIIISPLSEKYSKNKPNDITLNIETMSADDIKKTLAEAAKEAGEIRAEVPIEFLMKDSNGIPIAFPIFATKSSINLSPEMLKNLEEGFSFYVYRDKENIRTGLSINIKNKDDVLLEMSRDEVNLIAALSFLFLDSSVSEKPINFTENSYSGIDSRYFNIDQENSISIDYGVYENKLIIGTSKDTFRVIIDKIVSEKKNL